MRDSVNVVLFKILKSRVGETKGARFHVVAQWVCTDKRCADGLGLVGRKLMFSPHGQLRTRKRKEFNRVF